MPSTIINEAVDDARKSIGAVLDRLLRRLADLESEKEFLLDDNARLREEAAPRPKNGDAKGGDLADDPRVVEAHRLLFVEDLSYPEAAARPGVGVGVDTLYRWRRELDWPNKPVGRRG